MFEAPARNKIETELAAPHRDDRFAPSRATISVNRIGGGTAVNILAGNAWFDWDICTIPGIDGREVLARYEERLEESIIAPACRLALLSPASLN